MGKKLRCLLAEDHADLRAVLTLALEQNGWEVFTAKDGRDALRIYHDAMAGYEVKVEKGTFKLTACDARNFDLLLTDVEMPRLNGFAVGWSVRGVEKYGDVPRALHVYLTGYADVVPPQDLIESLFADGYIRKPLDTKLLLRQLTKLAGKK